MPVLPRIQHVRQIVQQPTITEVAQTVRQRWLESKLIQRMKPGQRILIACGSRGIRHIDVIVKSTVDLFRELGIQPSVIAAMGSHGGATPDGQREVLASYGITEERLGIPIIAAMDTEQIGVNSWGEPVWWDQNAMAADGVVTISRIKPHTDYRGPFESGIAKMCVIGLGKRAGAIQHHRWGWKGLQQMLPETMKTILEKAPILGGLGIIENAQEETSILEVVDRDDLLMREPQLLDQARALMPKIPFDEIDVLIIGEIGKNYSGAGIDPNVVGRLLIEAAPELETNRPKVTRMVALDLSPESHGNGTGVGIADLTTTRLLGQIDQVPFRMNNLTACFLWRSKIPFAFSTDLETIQCALETCWQPIAEQQKVVIIPNSLEVSDLWVSPCLANAARKNQELIVQDEAIEIPFLADGSLNQEWLFPHSVRGRRKIAPH